MSPHGTVKATTTPRNMAESSPLSLQYGYSYVIKLMDMGWRLLDCMTSISNGCKTSEKTARRPVIRFVLELPHESCGKRVEETRCR